MPPELCYGFSPPERPQVPDLKAAVVGARCKEVRDVSVPADDIYVFLVRRKSKHGPVLPAKVPHSDRFVGRT